MNSSPANLSLTLTAPKKTKSNTSSRQPNKTASQVKLQPNEKASPKLENFCRKIAYELRPFPERPTVTLQEFIWKFTKEFDFRDIPIRTHLDRLLTELGVTWDTEGDEKYPPTFYYDGSIRKWVIKTPKNEPDNALTGIKILHEVFEVVSWRCYYLIPWCKTWAAKIGMIDPHDKAEEFAFLVSLPDGRFRNLAKKMKYDLWKLAGYCQVPPHLCFQALNRYNSFSYPVFHAWVRCGEKPPLVPLSLFDDCEELKKRENWATIRRKNYKDHKKDDVKDWSGLDAETWGRWLAVDSLDKFPAEKTLICMSDDDVILTARRQNQVTIVKTTCVAGMPLSGEAVVIVYASPLSFNSVYFRVIPAGREEDHLGISFFEMML